MMLLKASTREPAKIWNADYYTIIIERILKRPGKIRSDTVTKGFIKKGINEVKYKQLQWVQRTNDLLKGFHFIKVYFVHFYTACLNNITL